MREAGKVVAQALRICREMARPGVRTFEINRAVEALYAKHGAIPLFKGYKVEGIKIPFPASTCISLNEQVVHGVPGSREIRDGDLIKIDTACKLNGWCADAAVTIEVGNVRPERRRLVEVAWQVLQIAIDELPRRRWWSEVAALCSTEVAVPGALKGAIRVLVLAERPDGARAIRHEYAGRAAALRPDRVKKR